ncbi:CKLF-like MARVEL transmembrane domain-containing protein 4 isoform X2 [Rhodnius prolixus]|uniref:CKLF-like MARVEL transmembrane domain-containing protein 4 isoform X2 n=1 Tax=Rhodnius prolixus TaxID=13249 RepID=UPI003D18C35C
MAEPNSADTTKPDNSLVWVKINLPYFRTPAGIVKLLQLLLGIICMACASPALLNGTHWFLFVSVLSFIATLIWVFVYLLSIREALTLPINWNLTELFNTGVLTILYLIAFVVQLSIWAPTNYRYRSPNIAAGHQKFVKTIHKCETNRNMV